MNNTPNSVINNSVPNPIKKCLKVKYVTVVIIDKTIVEKLRITENDTFLEQQITESGDILMQIKKIKNLNNLR